MAVLLVVWDGVLLFALIPLVPLIDCLSSSSLHWQTRIRRYYKHFLAEKTAFNESEILQELSTFLRQEVAMFLINDTIYRIPIFANRDPHFMTLLWGAMKPLQVGAGDYVISAGEFGREMFILLRGEMEVVADDDATVLAVLGPSSYFGELAVVAEAARHFVSVRASTPCELYSLARESLDVAFREYPEGGAG